MAAAPIRLACRPRQPAGTARNPGRANGRRGLPRGGGGHTVPGPRVANALDGGPGACLGEGNRQNR
eukprot:6385531-Lingulodinium_polyedra.AAC.1